MKSRKLGNTGITVSRLGLGTLTMSPIQRNLSVADGAEIILDALKGGVRFIDTAQSYGSYPQVAKALAKWKGARITIASKSAATARDAMRAAIEDARRSLDLDVIDVFLMHAVKDSQDFERRWGALDALKEAKDLGKIRAIGISSHFVKTIEIAAKHPVIDVLHPIVNRDGFGILDASLEVLLGILQKAHKAGKGIYAMKPLGGGHLRTDAKSALQWILSRPEIDCAVVGMSSPAEVEMNVAVAKGEPVSDQLRKSAQFHKRTMFINKVLCTGCGNCVNVCDQHAVRVKDGKADINPGHCVLCGYCGPKCPTFAIRVI